MIFLSCFHEKQAFKSLVMLKIRKSIDIERKTHYTFNNKINKVFYKSNLSM